RAHCMRAPYTSRDEWRSPENAPAGIRDCRAPHARAVRAQVRCELALKAWLLDLVEQCSRMARDHELLIRGNRPRRYATAAGTDARTAFPIGPCIELEAQPC